MKKRDFETYQKRLRDFEILPKFSETHVFRSTIRHPCLSCSVAEEAHESNDTELASFFHNWGYWFIMGSLLCYELLVLSYFEATLKISISSVIFSWFQQAAKTKRHEKKSLSTRLTMPTSEIDNPRGIICHQPQLKNKEIKPTFVVANWFTHLIFIVRSLQYLRQSHAIWPNYR